MRTIIVILCILLLITGCSKSVCSENGVNFEDSVEPAHSDDSSLVAVPDKDAAIAVAHPVFDSMEKDEYTENFVFDEVSYDSEQEAWVVSFWNDFSKPGPYSTGSLYITIRKKDAQVLSVFFGELMPDGSVA